MEILSVGEKIRRTRIYRGLTLKDVCNDKISISKMSCIENDKIKPNNSILRFIADKFDLDIDYLKQTTRDQIINNIKDIENNKNITGYIENIKYNLKFAEKYKCDDLCFKLFHLLFCYYLKNNELKLACSTIPKYYGYLCNCFNQRNAAGYYMDIAEYLLKNEDYEEAYNYYNNVENISKKINDRNTSVIALYSKIKCLLMTKKYQEVYKKYERSIPLINYVDENMKKAEIYHIGAVIFLRNNMEKSQEFIDKAHILYGNNVRAKANSMVDYSEVMFDIDIKDKALEYLDYALNIYPHDDIVKSTKFILNVINTLIKNNILNKANDLCTIALNQSIELDNIVFIEKAYYYKAIILEKKGDTESAETYMNFSLDALIKFGDKKTVYKRYMELGNMYYKMNNIYESIKYFNFALQLDKKF